MAKKVSAILIGAGQRGAQVYGEYALSHPKDIAFIAVAEPDDARRAEFCLQHGILTQNAEHDWHALLERPKFADCVFVCTQDNQHILPAIAALEKGYHVVLEKPVSRDSEELKRLLETARRTKRLVTVCHVLRYTPFFSKIREILDSGVIGSVQSIQQIENVAYWHQAHSYVRGNWRRADESSPMILAKCCHDMDILIWLTGKRARYVSSYGNNYLFRAEKAPAGAAQRCMDCAVRAGCPYDAVRYYLESGRTSVRAGRVHWPINVLDPHPTPENIEQALRTGPYGRCVYHCDNDVVDHQVVNIELDGGTTINFTMSAFTERCYRTIKVMGTHGCVEGNMDLSHLVWHDFFGHSEEMDLNVTDGSMAGHGGGDAVMVKQFVELLASGRDDEMLSSVEHSIESHLVALLAERSRLEHGRSLPVEL